MQRIPEPELMDDAEQALAYALADFSEPHNHFVELFKQSLTDDKLEGCILDLGCGPGDICLRMVHAFPAIRILGIDGASAMLALGREAIVNHGMEDRIELMETYLPGDLPRQNYAAVISNSLLHHLHDPLVLWRSIKSVAQPGTKIFIMDLMRPQSPAQAKNYVGLYAAGEPEILRHDFYHSLLAAYTAEEVEQQLVEENITGLQVKAVSDRHLIVVGEW